MGRTVKVVYHADTLQTEITVDGEPFDTSRINGKEIEDWAYPFMMRKVKWGGFYEEMVEALNGEKAFNLIFEGSKEALAELQEAWEDAPVTIVEETAEPTVEIEYDADALTTSITVNGEPFDTTRINGREIEDWVYPFMMRKIKWDGIFEELTKFIGSESYHISFTGEEKWLSALEEECPETVTISGKSKQETIDFAYISFNNNGFSISDKAFQEYYANMDHGMMTQHLSNEITNAMHQLIQNDSFSVSIQSITDVSGVMATDSICIANSIKQVIDCISKIYDSWDSPRANIYRSSNGIPWNQGFAIEISLSGRNNDKNSFANQENKSAKELYEMADACTDSEKAFALLKKSADLGYAEAQCTLATLYYLGETVEEDNEQAYFYYKKAAEQNHAVAQYQLGEMYYNGYAVVKNYYGAFKWYAKSAENGNLIAMLSLGNCYLYGEGTKKNVNQAISWYKKGADQNEPMCQYQLGMCYWNGNGVKKNISTALSLFEKSAQQGYAIANNKLGLIYHEGIYVEMDIQKAMSYYQLAADDGFPPAMYNLGLLYQDLNDVENARKWLNEALEVGFEDAREVLENLSDGELEIDINDPMDTTYDLEKHSDFHSALIHHSENIAPYSNDAEKNFIYSLFVFITPECSQKIISILSSLKDLCTENAMYNDVLDCYNDLTECYARDLSEETESQRVKNAKKITDMIYAYKKHGVMEWILTLIYNDSPKMSEFNPEKFQDAGIVLTSFNNKLKTLISEIKDDFKLNKDKIFTYFVEADNSIIRFMHYETDLTEQVFQNDYSEYEEEEKSADRKGMAACVAGGFFGSLIGAKIGMNYADRLSDEVEETRQKLFQKYIGNFKSDTYMCMIILALYDICDIASDCISENFDDENGFFDEI